MISSFIMCASAGTVLPPVPMGVPGGIDFLRKSLQDMGARNQRLDQTGEWLVEGGLQDGKRVWACLCAWLCGCVHMQGHAHVLDLQDAVKMH